MRRLLILHVSAGFQIAIDIWMVDDWENIIYKNYSEHFGNLEVSFHLWIVSWHPVASKTINQILILGSAMIVAALIWARTNLT